MPSGMHIIAPAIRVQQRQTADMRIAVSGVTLTPAAR
jgi:hypothetical protein